MSRDEQEFRLEVLKYINAYRSAHGSPDLELSQELSQYSQEWALHLRDKNVLQHRKDLKVGENLYRARGPNLSAKRTVDFWYNEIKKYDYDRAEFSPSTGHFTQIVWLRSQKLGVGVAWTEDMIYVVCNFEPFGNVLGQFAENVPKKRS